MTRNSDLACAAAMLQAAAQTLLDLSDSSRSDPSPSDFACPPHQTPEPDEEFEADEELAPEPAPRPGEQSRSPTAPRPQTQRRDQYRSYRVPFHILDDERELLAEYQVDGIADVLQEIYSEFFILRELMQVYAERNGARDFTYAQLAKQLGRPLSKLSKTCSVLVDFELQAPIETARA